MHPLNVWGRVAPEERYDRHALVDADINVFLDGKLEQQVYAKRVICKRAQASNLLSQ